MNIMDGFDSNSRTSILSRTMKKLHWHGKCSCLPRRPPKSNLNTFDKTDCTLETMPKLSRSEVDLWLSKVRNHAKERTSKYLNTFDLEKEIFGEIERHEKGSLLDYYEVSWRDYSFPYAKGAIDDNYPSLAERCFSDSQHILHVPESVSPATLALLLSFLKAGDYIPALGVPPSRSGENPSPILAIKDCIISERAQNNLLNDIRAYNLASSLGFIEMQTHVMRRLHSHDFIVSNPIPVIAAIYNCGSRTTNPIAKGSKAEKIPPTLRDWAKNFMAKTLPLQQGYFASNMAAMDYTAPAPGLYGLVVESCSSELASDYQSARSALWQDTRCDEKPLTGFWADDAPAIPPISSSSEDHDEPDFSKCIPPPPELPAEGRGKQWAINRYDSYRSYWDEKARIKKSEDSLPSSQEDYTDAL